VAPSPNFLVEWFLIRRAREIDSFRINFMSGGEGKRQQNIQSNREFFPKYKEEQKF
jgi:hypothetical protein